MRAVVQRVSSARVLVAGEVVGKIATGLAVLVGISIEDGEDGPGWLADRIANLRIFPDDENKMNRSVLDIGGEVLIVSQFTLYGDARRGRRPSFVRAASGPEAEARYGSLVSALRDLGLTTATGEFGATMQLELTNDGPTTILLDSDKKF